MAATVELSFDRVKYTVQTSLDGKPPNPIQKMRKQTKPRDLLLDCKAYVTSGHVLAILGPSGAGKTTLLNMLTLEKKGGVPIGHVNINGQPLTLGAYNDRCAFVQQYDALWASLTVREHLAYAVELYQPKLSAAEQKAAIDELIKSVGLSDFEHVKAGNEFTRGLSGGNKRRLSTAVALVKRPSVLFLDEPTSGVDSASAVMMMTFLESIAKSNAMAVACTIHQPPASVFAGFDNCLILSMGRVAYFGKASAMGEYFTSIGSAPPANTNLAEFVLDLVNKDFTPVEGVERILGLWAKRQGEAYGVEKHAEVTAASLPAVAPRAGFLAQIATLTRRSVVVAYREPLAYLVRIGANLGATIFFGIIYVKTRDPVQNQIQSKTFFLMFTIGIPMQFTLVAVYLYYYQWLAIRRECKDGMYHPVAAAIASWVVQTPMMFLMAASAMIPTFLIGDLHWPNFALAWLIYGLAFWAFEGLAQVMAIGPNVVFGLFNFLNLYFAAFLFCGMFVDIADVIWPLRALCYFLPLGYALQSFMYVVYHGSPEHEGTFPCTPGNMTPTGLICNYQGFYCSSADDPTGAVCYGKTGDQILNSLGVQFTIFSDEGHVARNLGLILAFGLLCRVGYAAQLYLLTKVFGGEEPLAPDAAAKAEVQYTAAPAPAGVAVAPAAEPASAPPSDLHLPSAAGAADAKCTFTFTNIGYSITPKALPWQPPAAPKVVLEGTSAVVGDGEVLAIVGPSGAGKTMLLSTLTFNKGPGVPVGSIELNGAKLTPSSFMKSCIYVPREDNLWPTLTARQHLENSYSLCKPSLTAAERAAAVDGLLAATGLASAQHTRAGGLLFQGLSGGQRRRLSLAIALVQSPRVILLDEPTSGLDSAAAAAIVTLLRSIAKTCQAAIVCTIHQPSAAVFGGFHKVLVLAEGRVAYCGGRDGMATHFAKIGKPLAKEANPAEAVLDLVSKDITSKEDVTAVLDAWAAAAGIASPAPPAATAGAEALVLSAPGGASCVSQTWAVLKRTAYLTVTDPTKYLIHLIMCPFLVCFFGLVYKESAEHVQVQVPFRLFFLWWVLAVPPCLNIITVIVTSFETRTVVYEMKNGMYKPLSYALSMTLVAVPMLLLLSFLINVFTFAIGGWPWDNYFTFCLQYAANLFVFETLAQVLSVVVANPIVGMLGFLCSWSSSIIFCGLVFRGGDVIWPFRLFYYILPLRWLFNGTGYDVYTPSTYTDAQNCVPGAAIVTNQGSGVCQSQGFFCFDASSTLGCYGREGHQVLDTLHMTYESLDSKDERLMDTLIMLGMVLALKVAHTAALWRAVSASDSPAPAGTVSATRSAVPPHVA